MTTETNETKEKKRLAVHDLFSREIRPIRNWCEFLARWQVAVTLEEMLGLLHAGFGISDFGQWHHGEEKYEPVDRLIFYFGIADGWTHRDLLRAPTDGQNEYGVDKYGNAIRKSPGKLRQILATKAFDLLCLNFFQPGEKKRPGPREENFIAHWERLIVTEELFPTIMNFFRAEKGLYSDNIVIRNLSHRSGTSHNEQLAIAFLLDLATFLWKWQERYIESWKEHDNEYVAEITAYNLAMSARVDGAKLWMIEVLSYLGRLDVLDKVILELDENCLAKLREIAMRNEFEHYRHPVKEDRPVATLDEACYLGSAAAWFLKRHGLKRREYNRLEAIREAEREVAEKQRELKKLKG